MSINRRTFLASAAGAGIGAPMLAHSTAPRPAPEALRVLVLGGTAFLGPVIVEHAVSRGHAVTLFNRGRTNAHLFPELDKIEGDRNVAEDLAKIGEGKWDVIIDTCGYFPSQVEQAVAHVAEHASVYCFVSTLSVFPSEPGSYSEDDPVATISDEACAEVTSMRQITGENYGPLKARCEAAAAAGMPGRALNVRPGLIVGPRDRSDRFTYWPSRIARGGEVLAPGNPDAPVQFIDVRDLGEWIVRLCEQKITGTYNAVGFEGPVTLEEVLHGCKIVLGASCTFSWADAEFLAEHDVRPWAGPDSLPLWIPGDAIEFQNAAAIAQGLTFRPIADTIRATREWEVESGHELKRGGLSAGKEAEVLKALHAASTSTK